MNNHTTTAETDLFAPAKPGQINTLIRHVFDGLPENAHPAVPGQPRVISRREAELLTLAVDLHSLGLSPKAIKTIVNQHEVRLLSSKETGVLAIDAHGRLSIFNELSDELKQVLSDQNCRPLIVLRIRHIKRRVQQAIEYTEVRRWNFDPNDVANHRPKTQAEIKAALDRFIARRNAGEFA